MNVAILAEPTSTGFRASTGAPFSLSVEAPTESEAVAAVQAMLRQKFLAGSRVHHVAFDVERFQAAWDELANDPHWDEHLAAIAEYRRMREEEEVRREQESEAE